MREIDQKTHFSALAIIHINDSDAANLQLSRDLRRWAGDESRICNMQPHNVIGDQDCMRCRMCKSWRGRGNQP